jgi:hypothetical protein
VHRLEVQGQAQLCQGFLKLDASELLITFVDGSTMKAFGVLG